MIVIGPTQRQANRAESSVGFAAVPQFFRRIAQKIGISS